jgi:bacterioferritin-associated ferredoxin
VSAAVLVCLCQRVSEGEVRAAVAKGAATVAELQRVCGAGTDCGSCWDDLRALLREGRGCERALFSADPGRPAREQDRPALGASGLEA